MQENYFEPTIFSCMKCDGTISIVKCFEAKASTKHKSIKQMGYIAK